MKVSDLLEARRGNWRELEQLCWQMEGRSRRRVPPETVARFSALYRSACADLALADAYQLPSGTVHYLHQLVGRAHNQLYRTRTFHVGAWLEELFVHVPQRLFADNCLRLAFAIFWGVFIVSAVAAYQRPDFAEQIIEKEWLQAIQEMFSEAPTKRDFSLGGGMTGFYIWHNPNIGLQCFAFGLVFGIAGLVILIANAAQIGAIFGYMAQGPQAENFFTFVTAHGPFELTAVVLAAAAGMRLGFALVDTQGFTRADSLRRVAEVAVPNICAAILMFVLAAGIEGFISPSSLPYAVKAAVAVVSCGLLMFYFVLLGYPRTEKGSVLRS